MSFTKFWTKAFSPKYLYITNTALGTGALLTADFVQQNVEHHLIYRRNTPRVHDYRRSLSMAIGGFSFGATGHLWYKFLDKRLPGNAKSTIAKKIGLELMLSPVFFIEAFVVVGFFEGRSLKESLINFKNNFPLVFTVDCLVWTPLQAINFYFLPPRFRFLYVSSITLLYDVFFSFVLHRSDYVVSQTKIAELTVEASQELNT